MLNIYGVIQGNTIVVQHPLGFPDGQEIVGTIEEINKPPEEPLPPDFPRVELWADRLVFDSKVNPAGERIVKGTTLEAEPLVKEIAEGKTDEEMLGAHPELTAEDVAALRVFSRVPGGLRRSLGAWAEDAEELDKYLEWIRQNKKIRRREIDD